MSDLAAPTGPTSSTGPAPPTAPAPATAPASSWPLWRRQGLAIMRLEARKSFLGRRALLLYLVALLPVFAMAAFALVPLEWRESDQLGWATQIYAGVYQGFLLRTVVFFGCLWVFTHLFRGEVLDRSLHYYFLAPVRREVLVAAKYLAGLAATLILFGGSTLLSYLLLFPPYGLGRARDYLLAGPGLAQLGTYLGVTALGCLGYGAVFLLTGVLFRNPILPAAILFFWEWINFLLPSFLKKVSVVHYLKSLCPVPISEGPFALVADPPPAWASIAGLLAVTALLLALTVLRLRRMEIDYGDD